MPSAKYKIFAARTNQCYELHFFGSAANSYFTPGWSIPNATARNIKHR